MSFLNPSLLWGLLAISIPIIIHLFNFRRVKKLNFPNIALLKAVNTQAKTFLKMKQWLALAARILFISCLVLAFAQPFIPSKNGLNKDGRSVASIYIDNSASMQNEADNISILNTAIKKLNKLAEELPKSAKSQLITNDFSSNEFANLNPTELKNQGSKIEISGSVRSLNEVINRQRNLAEKANSSKGNSFFLFSDFQKSTLGEIDFLNAEKDNHIYLVPNQPNETHNIYVDSVWLDNPFIRKMQNNGLTVRIANSGNKAVSNLPIKLFLGDIQMNAIPTKIEAKASANVHFDFTANQTGFQKGKITFDDNPVIFDNSYYFVLNASPSVNIIHLYGNNSPNFYLKNAFSNDSLFKYSSFPANNIDLGILKNADFLIVDELDNLNNTTIPALNNFLQNGGCIMMVPSEKMDLSNFNTFLNQNGITNLVKNLQENPPMPIADAQKESRFFKDIFEQSKLNEKLMMPSILPFLKWNNFGDQILKTKGGQNVLTISKAKKGSIVMLAAPLNEQFGNFQQNALFVPIMYKIAAMSIKPSALAYRFDEKAITFESKNYSEKTIIKLRKDGYEMIPIQKVINNELYLELPKQEEYGESKSLQSGFYEMVNGNNIEKLLAINFSNKESLMDCYTTKELKNLFAKNKNIEVLDQENATDFAAEYKAQNEGKYFWKYFIIAALVFLAIEILIIRFWK